MSLASVFMFLCVSMLFNSSHGQAVGVEIISPPENQEGPEVVIIMIPATAVPGEGYSDLAHTLQEGSSFRLWVALTTYPDITRTFPLVNEAVDLTFKELEAQNVPLVNVFIGGQGLGGAIGQEVAAINKERVAGFLFFAAILPSFESVEGYPLPFLAISGDLDGLNRLTRMLTLFDDVSKLSDSERFSKQVVIVDGMNNGHFINPASIPPFVAFADIQTDVARTVTLAKVSQTVNWFIICTLRQPSSKFIEAKTNLEQAFKHTEEIFEPLMRIRALDENGNGVSPWAIEAQKLAAGIDTESNPNIKIQALDENLNAESPRQSESQEFSNENPNIQIENRALNREPFLLEDARDTEDDGKVKIKTFTYLQFPANSLDNPLNVQGPSDMMVKMVSRDSILEQLPDAQLSPPLTCRQINEEALKRVLMEISETARQRWETRSRKITFFNDFTASSQDVWFNVAVALVDRQENPTLLVQSPSWSTDVGTWPFQVAGVQYCKLLSPFRTAEWVYVDSLRFTEP